jgi:hypothetical protein
MEETELVDGADVTIGGLSPQRLRDLLELRGVRTNDQAEILLAGPAFESSAPLWITVVERSVGALGFPAGATFPELIKGAQALGLVACPPETGPYLRLALPGQAESADSILRVGRAPSASLSVIAEPLTSDGTAPRGFYLRVVDGERWLRGYSCDDDHVWSADDRLVWRRPDSAGVASSE